MKKKIIVLKEKEGDTPDIKFDFLVYSYESGSYEGSGFAVWRRDNDFFYHDMGHCSCYGGWDQMDKSNGVACTWNQIKKLSKKHYGDYAKEVIEYIEAKKLNI